MFFTLKLPKAHNKTFSKSQLNLINSLRLLWEQHALWTRSVIVSIAFGLPDMDLVTQKLFGNSKDLGQIFETYYGRTIATNFVNIFKEHLEITVELVKAIKANDNDAAADAEQRWYQNANEIAAFLYGLNYFWSIKERRKMLKEHLKLVKAEAINILTGNYEDGIEVYDEMERQTLEMADEMAKGMFKQFPNRFVN